MNGFSKYELINLIHDETLYLVRCNMYCMSDVFNIFYENNLVEFSVSPDTKLRKVINSFNKLNKESKETLICILKKLACLQTNRNLKE